MSWMILFKKQLFDLEVKGPRRSLRYATHRLMVMHPHTKYHWPISKDKNVMDRTRTYYLKNNYLTLRSKVNVSQRSLRYATHRLMVMHPHTKYNWPIWKDKKVMVRTSFTEKKQKKRKKQKKKRKKQKKKRKKKSD
jgi:acyl-CoA thioesterase FadM